MQLLNKSDIARLRQLLDQASNVVITTHMSPDGDALGSSLGLANALYAMGKDAKVIVPDHPSQQLSFLPNFKYIEIFCSNPEFSTKQIAQADIVFCLDYNALSRIDRMAKAVEESPAPKVMIDHHLDPQPFCDITFSQSDCSSASLLTFKVLCALELDDAIDRDVAQCLLAGMMTDTGNFSFNANDPYIYKATAELVSRGADKDRLTKLLFDTFSADCLRLNAYAISNKMDVWENRGAALITLNRKELNEHHYRPGYTEGLVNKPLAIPRVVYSVFLREETEYIKVSMRSKGDFPCDVICAKYFNGGGHRNAAGGEFRGSMEQCVIVFKSLLDPNYENYIKNNRNIPI